MKVKLAAWTLAALMCGAAVAGVVARPSHKASPIHLESTVPKSFGQWTELREQVVQIVDPQTQGTIDGIYDEVISRTYVNKEGYRIMLSMAYGGDQRGVLQAHRPEICYPAQGFEIGSIEDGALTTAFGPIDVRRLTTKKGKREEPVTYWLTIGDQVAKNNIEKRLIEILLGLTGQIPGGLLYRVSSIDSDPERAFAMQQSFVAEMMASVPPAVRHRFSGLKSPAGAT